MKYTKSSLLDWFSRTSGINSRPNQNEVQITCPLCGGNKLYFNIQKQVGICHKASCKWHDKVFLEDLIEVFGFSPDQQGEWELSKEIEQKPIVLPGYPILIRMGTQLLTSNQDVLDYLRGRGINDLTILNWRLTYDETTERIYIPVYDTNSTLVNYNSRSLNVLSNKKYRYCPGRKISHYILGWKECRDWEQLVLVENTFVSLAYRNRMQCSTTFGSNISEVQADLIANSRIKEVIILWDENAESSADRALRKLQDRGIKAVYWKILRQPDDYPIEWVEEKVKQLKEAMNNGIPWIDFRKECREIKNENQ